MADSKCLLGAAALAAGAGFVWAWKTYRAPAGFGAKVQAALAVVEVIGPAEAQAYIKEKKPLIIDVRDSNDADGGIQGSVNIPLSELYFKADQDFALDNDVKVKGAVKVPKGTKFVHDNLKGPKDQPILVSCALGGQALIGAQVLVDYGFTQVKAIHGGNHAWMDIGGAICACTSIMNPTTPATASGKLALTVVEATNLKNTDSGMMGDVSDPFVKISYHTQDLETAVIKDNLNPKWNKDFELKVGPTTPKDLKLEVFDYNKFHSHTTLGSMTVAVQKLESGVECIKYEPLVGGGEGKLRLKLKFTADSA